MTIKRVSSWPYHYGGEENSGWLPSAAATPLPMAVNRVLLDIEIASDGASGFLLLYAAQDGSISNDNWYQTLVDAEGDAERLFGVTAADWKSEQDS
jgi:hypothetical protein